MIVTDDATMTQLCSRLRFGPMGNDHSPFAVANVIAALCEERRALLLQRNELEAMATPQTGAAFRSAYARGWADCATAVLRALPLEDLRDEILALRPSYGDASRVAGVAVEIRQ